MPRLIPSNKKELLVPPPLEPTPYRIPRLAGDVNPSGSSSAMASGDELTDATTSSRGGGASAKRVSFSTAGNSPAHAFAPADEAPVAAPAARRDSSSSVGVRQPSHRRGAAGHGMSPPHRWGAELDNFVRWRDAPAMERLPQSPRGDAGSFADADASYADRSSPSRHADASMPWAQNMDGSDYYSPVRGGASTPGPTPHHQKKRHKTPLEWLMQARQHEVSVHNTHRWKSPAEAFASLTRPAMHTAGGPQGPRHGSRASSPSSTRYRPRAQPSDVTGVQRLRGLSTASWQDDRTSHARLQERRRQNALAVRAQMRSLSPRRRQESAVTFEEKPQPFSESARWFAGPAAVLGSPRNIKYGNDVPGPGAYEMPRTFGAPR